MIVVTGGAGFIGSALVWALNRRGEDDILIVDQLHETEKWKNLVGLRFSDYLDKTVFIDQLTRGDSVIGSGRSSTWGPVPPRRKKMPIT